MKRILKYILLAALLLFVTGCNENNDILDNIDETYSTMVTCESTTADLETTEKPVVVETSTTAESPEDKKGYGSISYRLSADKDMDALGVGKKLIIISDAGLGAQLDPSVASRFNEVLVKDCGCDFVVEFVDYEFEDNEYTYAEALTDTMNMGQQADIIISGATGWSSFYTNLINNGLFMDITDYLGKTEEGQKLYVALPETAWQGVERDGRIYGCDTAMNIYGSYRIVCNKQKAEELGIEVKEGFSFYDIGEILGKIEGGLPSGVIGIAAGNMSDYDMLGYCDMSGIEYIQHGVYAKQGDDGEWTAFNPLTDDEFVKFVKTIREYKDKGWLRNIKKKNIENIISMQDGEFLFYCGSFVPGVVNLAAGDRIVLTNYDNDMYEVVTGTTSVFLKGLRECNVTGVASWTEYKEEALKLLTLMQTEEKLVNLLMWGIDGEDYRYIDREVIKTSEKSTDGGLENRAYMVNKLLSYPQFVEPDNKAEYYKELVKDFGENPFMQYEITDDEYRAAIKDYANVELQKIWAEYYNGLLYGEYEDVEATVAEIIKRQEAARIDKLIDSINKLFEEARGNE